MATTLPEAIDHLAEVRRRFDTTAAEWEQLAENRMATSDWPIREMDARLELVAASEELRTAQAEHDRLVQRESERQRQEATQTLQAAEQDLKILVPVAEAQIAALVESIGKIINLRRTVYSARQTIDGQAPRKLLASEPIVAWIKNRMASLELAELRPARHERGITLAAIVGVTIEEGGQAA